MVRIGIPLLSIVLGAQALGQKYVGAEGAVLWSVYCEIMYYALYPMLVILLRYISVARVIAGSVVVSGILMASSPRIVYLWEFSYNTWLYCLPFWLAGVFMAERFRTPLRSVGISIWLWRVPALTYGVVVACLIAHSSFVIGLIWTMPPFAFYSYFWIRREIDCLSRHPSPVLESLGRASYSMYLVHPVAICFFYQNLHLSPILGWVVLLLLIGIGTAAFYFAVEKPSHNLARYWGRRPLAVANAS